MVYSQHLILVLFKREKYRETQNYDVCFISAVRYNYWNRHKQLAFKDEYEKRKMTIATALYPSAKDIYVLLEPTKETFDFYSIRLTRSGRIVKSKVMLCNINMFSLPQYEIRYTCIMTWFFVHTSIQSNNVKNIFAHLRLFTLIFVFMCLYVLSSVL